MKIAKRKIPDGFEGGYSVSLLPEDPEDMWHIYNLIIPGDVVHAHTSRKVSEEVNGRTVTMDHRVHLELGIRVRSITFDPITSILRTGGHVVTENSTVPLDSHHSIEFEPHRSFSLIREEPWDSVAEDTLRQALSDDKNNALAAVVMHEGLANICLITEFRTVHKTRIEVAVPRKRDTTARQDAGLRSFFEKTLHSLLRAADFTQPRPLLLASPGFVAEDFKKYIADQARDKSDKALTAVAKLATVVHAASGHVHSLNEALKSPEVLAKMKDVRYAREAQLMDKFFDKLKLDDGRAWYGTKAVEKAVQERAVGQGGGVLLINNSLFRSEDLGTRKRYVALVDKVKADGGEVRVLSSDHGSGQRLQLLGDIAAILTYPMLDLDEEEEEEEQTEPEHRNGAQQDEIDRDMLNGVI